MRITPSQTSGIANGKHFLIFEKVLVKLSFASGLPVRVALILASEDTCPTMWR